VKKKSQRRGRKAGTAGYYATRGLPGGGASCVGEDKGGDKGQESGGEKGKDLLPQPKA